MTIGFETERTEDEINTQVNEAMKHRGRWSGMTYEQGVADALEWILGNSDLAPMDDQ